MWSTTTEDNFFAVMRSWAYHEVNVLIFQYFMLKYQCKHFLTTYSLVKSRFKCLLYSIGTIYLVMCLMLFPLVEIANHKVRVFVLRIHIRINGLLSLTAYWHLEGGSSKISGTAGCMTIKFSSDATGRHEVKRYL